MFFFKTELERFLAMLNRANYNPRVVRYDDYIEVILDAAWGGPGTDDDEQEVVFNFTPKGKLLSNS